MHAILHIAYAYKYDEWCIILQPEGISQSESSITSEYKSVFHT